ncbi:MAG: Asparagine synthetase [glutamine-hydrolyzing] 1 [Chlamydiales bacterium]|nr:Asparagine synthetase [glutamine-hydrolyzing] 1 [Chlamydiales bacterium]
MPTIAGMIHPSAFQITDVLTSIHPDTHFKSFRHKNLELGSWHSPLICNERKNIWALLDGQIHNAKELRIELNKKLGYRFTTETDEEILVHAYDAWKEGFVKKLQGPFALAIFDVEKEKLFLAIDKLGQKPLYWTSHNNCWLFATQAKALLSTGVIPQTPSIESLASYLYFGFIPQDLSIIRGVNKLLPGHSIHIDLKRQAAIEQYWSLSEAIETPKSTSSEEAIHLLGELIDSSISQTLSHTETTGTFLSGNLGSSTLGFFLTHRKSRNLLKAYSALFKNARDAATKIAEKLDLSYYSKQITPADVIEELPKIVWHLDEPIADPYIMQTWYLCKLAAKQCPTAYSDTGWIEMFGGSKKYFEKAHAHNSSLAFSLAQYPPLLRDRCILPFLGLFSKKMKFRILRNIDLNREQLNYLADSALFKGKERKKVSPLLFKAFDPEVFTQRFHRVTALAGNLNPSLYYDAKTKLPDSSLYQYERLADAHHLKLITPYLNPTLVDFLAKLPEEIKLQNHKPAGLLQKLMEKLCHGCPQFTEQGDDFLETWRDDPQMREMFELVQVGCLEDEGLISKKWIKQQLAYPHLTKRNFRQLWALLVLEVWFRLFIKSPLTQEAPTISLKELLTDSE